MSKIFIGRFVASILALLIAGSLLLTYGQSQSDVLSDEDEADILESLVQLDIQSWRWEFPGVRALFSENISQLSKTRLAKHGFYMTSDTQGSKQGYVAEYMVIKRMYRRDGIVVVPLSVVRESSRRFGGAAYSERFFTYEYQKSAQGWVGRLVHRTRRHPPFPIYRHSP